MGAGGQPVKDAINRRIVPAVGIDDPLADPINKDLRLTGRIAGHKPKINPGAVKGQADRIPGRARVNSKAATRPRIGTVSPGRSGLFVRKAVVAQGEIIFFMADDAGSGRWWLDKRRRAGGREPISHRPIAKRLDLHDVRPCSQPVKGDSALLGNRAVQVKNAL